MRNLRIFIVEESPFFRTWFRKLILTTPRIRIIGEERDPVTALDFISKMKPDAIIMDVKAQWRLKIDLIERFRKITPIPKIIVFTSEIYGRHQRQASEKADVVLDKIIEYRKLPEILTRFASTSASAF